MDERFDDLDDLLLTTAATLAAKGYEVEHPDATEEEADAWTNENVHLYIEDAWDWLMEEGKRIQAVKSQLRGGNASEAES